MSRQPSYLRIVATTACPLACPYCHGEGDVGSAPALPRAELEACLRLAVVAGVTKLKFVGGEPLVRPDLADVVRTLRRWAPTADLSLITSGAVPPTRVEALFQAGLDRMNLTIHGWTRVAFARRGGGPRLHDLRGEVVRLLLAIGRPLKLNYVYDAAEEDDLAAFLDWAAGRQLIVGLLDSLHDDDASAALVARAARRLRGPWARHWQHQSPHTLATTRLAWPDGLVMELKTACLRKVAPWSACLSCPLRPRCREGILALRLTHDGRLQRCLLRPDLGMPLLPLLDGDEAAAAAAWHDFAQLRRGVR